MAAKFRKAVAGFTLLELLIAMVVFALIAAYVGYVNGYLDGFEYVGFLGGYCEVCYGEFGLLWWCDD